MLGRVPGLPNESAVSSCLATVLLLTRSHNPEAQNDPKALYDMVLNHQILEI